MHMLYLCALEALLVANLWSPYVIGQTIYNFILFLSSIFFYFLPNLSGRTLDVCHTSMHSVALVQI